VSPRRIIIAGGLGFFGAAAAERLRRAGHGPLVAARRPGADLLLDVEDAASLRAALRPGDVVLDAAGPFQRRSTTLVEAAIEIGCDVVDLADSLRYVRDVYALSSKAAAAGVAVLTACSTVSAVSAAAVRESGIARPERLTGLLVPAAAHSAATGSAKSLLQSVGRPVEVLQGGRLAVRAGWRTRHFRFPSPLGERAGFLLESADGYTLPLCWPSLRTVELYVNPNVPGLAALLRLAARFPFVRRSVQATLRPGLWVSRWLGSRSGGIAYEIEGEGRWVRIVLTAPDHGYVVAVAPAVLAIDHLARGDGDRQATALGVVPPDQHVKSEKLMAYLTAAHVRCSFEERR
jgi:hypothetical protein